MNKWLIAVGTLGMVAVGVAIKTRNKIKKEKRIQQAKGAVEVYLAESKMIDADEQDIKVYVKQEQEYIH